MKSIAEEIIKELKSRKHFDHWWHDIDSDIKNEIIESIADLIDEHIDKRSCKYCGDESCDCDML